MIGLMGINNGGGQTPIIALGAGNKKGMIPDNGTGGTMSEAVGIGSITLSPYTTINPQEGTQDNQVRFVCLSAGTGDGVNNQGSGAQREPTMGNNIPARGTDDQPQDRGNQVRFVCLCVCLVVLGLNTVTIGGRRQCGTWTGDQTHT